MNQHLWWYVARSGGIVAWALVAASVLWGLALSTKALGKPANHLPTSGACENCHRSTVSFAGTRMNHTGIVSNCASCHNGTFAPGKPSGHPRTSAPCESCHKSTTSWSR